ncbi:MAG: hypothetical protein K1X75_11820 [Leptospirales bacterium]|nr:hypothetical protein [Leptospirales bacterium]
MDHSHGPYQWRLPGRSEGGGAGSHSLSKEQPLRLWSLHEELNRPFAANGVRRVLIAIAPGLPIQLPFAASSVLGLLHALLQGPPFALAPSPLELLVTPANQGSREIARFLLRSRLSSDESEELQISAEASRQLSQLDSTLSRGKGPGYSVFFDLERADDAQLDV